MSSFPARVSVVVTDATPLIAFSKIGQLHCLANLFGEIFVPQAVYDEVTISGKERSGVTEIVAADWLVVREVEDRSRVDYLLTQLDMGEAEALVLAQEIQADLVLVDERKARAVATDSVWKSLEQPVYSCCSRSRESLPKSDHCLINFVPWIFDSATESTLRFYRKQANRSMSVYAIDI